MNANFSAHTKNALYIFDIKTKNLRFVTCSIVLCKVFTKWNPNSLFRFWWVLTIMQKLQVYGYNVELYLYSRYDKWLTKVNIKGSSIFTTTCFHFNYIIIEFKRSSSISVVLIICALILRWKGSKWTKYQHYATMSGIKNWLALYCEMIEDFPLPGVSSYRQ